MNKLATAAALLALLPATCIAGTGGAGSFSQPDAADGGRAIVLAGGMGGGSGGMGGGSSGMGGGAVGMGSGAFGMGGGGGHFGGGMLGAPFGGPADFDRPSAATADKTSSAPPDNYTYQCITPSGRCSFVAPAALRANALRSGAGCGCGGGQPQGRIE